MINVKEVRQMKNEKLYIVYVKDIEGDTAILGIYKIRKEAEDLKNNYDLGDEYLDDDIISIKEYQMTQNGHYQWLL